MKPLHDCVFMAPKFQNAKSLSMLEHDLDLIFSTFIAYRDFNNGWKCFICGTRIPSKSYGQVCHFIPRAKMPTRYDELNCHFGCVDCNCFDADHYDRYELKMIEVYGVSEVAQLTFKSNGLQKFMRCDIEEMILEYKEKVAQIRKLKGL